jgi:hypothetical protein
VLAVNAIAAPRPVTTSDGQRHLVYELVLQNVSDAAQRITALEVFSSSSQIERGHRAPLASFSGEALAPMLVTVDATGNIAPGDAALVFVDLSLSPEEQLPAQLRQRLRSATGERVSATVEVVRERAIRLSPPLRGENLVDLNGCCQGAHGRAVLPTPEGGLAVAQRYAIDFLRVENGSSLAGDPSDNASYFIFGAEVLAAAPGRIVAVRDTVAENDPTLPLPEFDLDAATGNFVVEDIGDGHFALYAHLQPGSVQVRAGERVQRGQALGLVGNTGNSDEPHLHFQVMDGPVALAANGLPYVFDEFRLQGHLELRATGPSIVPTAGAERRKNRLPLELDVVAFD